MASILEHFDNDFKQMSIDRTLVVQRTDSLGQPIDEVRIEVKERIRQESGSSGRFFTYFIPRSIDTFAIIAHLLNGILKRSEEASSLIMIGNFAGDIQVGIHKSGYSQSVYFYTETPLNEAEVGQLDEICKTSGFFVTLRSSEYVKRKLEMEKPVAFISHDSRDKDLIARPLAYGLSSRLCTVWYDEFSLSVGDSLRDSIEKGIKESKKCIVVLTKNYLKNLGWTKKEFDSAFTREMIFTERIVLPIWYGVSKQEVYEYSPSLADTVALIWPSFEDMSEELYKQKVEQLISKIHTSLTS